MKNNKKAFTIVEIVIIIAVIAILAAVLIPTFSNIIKKSQTSSDTQLIRNLNDALAIDLAQKEEDKHETCFDAMMACEEAGYNVARIVSKSGYNIAWDKETGHFVLLDEQNDKVLYPVSLNSNKEFTLTEEQDKTNYFVVRYNITSEEYNAPEHYSLYAGVGFKAKKVNLNGVGFDAGSIEGIDEINYNNNSSNPKNVIIRTNTFGTKVTIDGPSDTVTHYGLATEVYVKDVAVGTYIEDGTVCRLIYSDNSGLIKFLDNALVYCYMNTSGDNNANLSNVSKTEKTKVYSHSDDSIVDVSTCQYHHVGEYDIFENDSIVCVCKHCGAFCIYQNGEFLKQSTGLTESNKFEVIPVEEILISLKQEEGQSEEIKVGAALTLSTIIMPLDATFKSVEWTSSDETVATVIDGVVTAVKEGNAVITAKAFGGLTDSINVTVKENVHVHNYGEWQTIENPSCTEEGLKVRQCLDQDCDHLQHEYISRLGHKPVQVEGENYYQCENCKDIFLDSKAKDLVHIEDIFIVRNENEENDTRIVELTQKAINSKPATITIPEFIEEIEENAFKNCDFIEKVEFNSDVIIDENAFYGCTKLNEIDGNEHNIILETGAFMLTGLNTNYNTTFKDCNFIIKTGEVGIDLESYGSDITFINCTFTFTISAAGDTNAITCAIIIRDSEASTKDTTLIFKDCDYIIDNTVNNNSVSLIQIDTSNDLNVSFDSNCTLPIFDANNNWLFYCTGGANSNKLNVYAEKASSFYNQLKVENKNNILLSSASSYDRIYVLKDGILGADPVETVSVTTIEELINALKNSNAVVEFTPTSNVSLNKLEIGMNQDVTINLTGKTLTFNGMTVIGKLTVNGGELHCEVVEGGGLGITSNATFNANETKINTIFGYYNNSNVKFTNCTSGDYTLIYNETTYGFETFNANLNTTNTDDNQDDNKDQQQGDQSTTYNVTTLADLITALNTYNDITLTISSDLVINDEVMVGSGKKVTINATNNAEISISGEGGIAVDNGTLLINNAKLNSGNGSIVYVNFYGGTNSTVTLTGCSKVGDNYFVYCDCNTMVLTYDGATWNGFN